MNDNYGEFVGVDNLYFAKVIDDSLNNFILEAPRYLAPVGEASGQAKENKSTSSYDNKMRYMYFSEGETDVNLTVSNIPAYLLAEINGKAYSTAAGRMYDSGEPKKPYYALGFRYEIGEGQYRYQWFLKGTFSAGTEAAKSRGENVDIKPYQFVYSAIPTIHIFEYQDSEGVTKQTPIKRVVGDTTDAAFNPTGWFAQVQTPDTEGAPDAIELSSIVPADNAADVAVDANIVITFNNPIKSNNIIIVDTSAGSILTTSKSWDTSRTILTIAHATAFNNSTLYNVVLAGVIDDYNQELEVVIKDFTTIAA